MKLLLHTVSSFFRIESVKFCSVFQIRMAVRTQGDFFHSLFPPRDKQGGGIQYNILASYKTWAVLTLDCIWKDVGLIYVESMNTIEWEWKTFLFLNKSCNVLYNFYFISLCPCWADCAVWKSLEEWYTKKEESAVAVRVGVRESVAAGQSRDRPLS